MSIPKLNQTEILYLISDTIKKKHQETNKSDVIFQFFSTNRCFNKVMYDEITMLAKERFELCQVCGEASSGWHCGAIVCEACKKFFLRSVNSGEEAKYKCARNRLCVIVRSTRNQCQYCRFQRCKQVGMNINTGIV